MSFQTMVKGQSDWHKVVNSNATYAALTKGTKQTAGITALNGVTLTDQSYTITKFGDVNVLSIAGTVTGLDAAASSLTAIAKFPDGLVPDDAFVVTNSVKNAGGGDKFINISYANDGTVSVTAYDQQYASWKFPIDMAGI